MSEPTFTIDVDVVGVDEPIKKPAKAWRNWWECLVDFKSIQTGLLYDAGKIYPSQLVWPSKEIAEQKAADYLAREQRLHPFSPTGKYLGAYPEGQRP